MKILHVLYSGLGGHGNVFFSLVDADANKIFEQEVLFNGIEEVREEYVNRCSKKNINWFFVKKKPGRHIKYFFKLFSAIKKSAPAIVFLHGSNAILPARLAKMFSKNIKLILVRETQANHLKTRANWIMLSFSMLFAGRVVYLSEAYRQQVKSTLKWLYKEKRTAVIPNGINLVQFSPSPKPTNEKIVLGMQSRVTKIKDHETLLKAVALLKKENFDKPIILKVAGDGENMAALVKLTETLSIKDDVIFTGLMNEGELPGFLNSLDIYIHASFGETMSTAIMQAMACKKTIVASDVPGINNMIADGVNGLLVPVKNETAMAAVLKQLITNKEESNRLAEAALTFAGNNFSNLTMFEKYKEQFVS